MSREGTDQPRAGLGDGESNILSDELREWWIHGVVAPLEKFLIRHRVQPLTITLFGTVMIFVVSVLFVFGKFFWAGWLLLFAASFDFLDGRVARATGRTSRMGGFLDSVTDRYADACLFGGLTIYYRDHWILYFGLAGLVGSFLVSYTKARAENFGIPCKVGLMQRAERIAVLGISGVIGSYMQIALMPFYPPKHVPPHHLLMGVIVLLAVTTNFTALQRVFYTIRELNLEKQK